MSVAKLRPVAVALMAMLLSGMAGARPAVHPASHPDRWVSGELLVGFRAGVAAPGRHALYQKHDADFLEDIGPRTRIVRIKVPAGTEDAVLQRLARMPEVKFVEKNYEFRPSLIPDDPEYIGQWHLPLIQADLAWDLTQGGANAVIAILDSGIDPTQPDLASKLLAGYNTFSNTTDTTDAFGHGTEVAGVAGALTNNGAGVAGVAGASPILPVRVTNAAGAATAASIANGIIWATDHGARVINISFDGVAGNATIGTAAEYAFNHGTLVVAAAGNCSCADATAENPFIVSVSATDEVDALGYYSSTGPYVDIAAPGSNIMTTAKFGLYLPDSGTSLASPVVAGVAALMFSAQSALTPALATQLLEASAVDLGNPGYDNAFGYGRVNALAAVNAAINYAPPADTTPPTVLMGSPNAGATVSGTTVVDAVADDNVGVVKVDLFVDGVFYATDNSSPFSFAWDTTTLGNGAHSLQLVASDAASNSASTPPVSVTVANTLPDTTPPTVSINAPAAGARVSGLISVTASASDNTAVVRTELYVDGQLSGTDTSAPYAFTVDTARIANGAHALDVLAADAAGNVAHARLTISVANPAAHAPVAVDDAFRTPFRSFAANSALGYAVLANDRDADGDLDVASVSIAGTPDHGGVARANRNGTISYMPVRGFRGTETFRYTVKDKRGAVSNVAAVTITVVAWPRDERGERDGRNLRGLLRPRR